MKNIFLSTLCLIAFTYSPAQSTFAPVGAEWHYVGRENNYDYSAGNFFPETTWNDHVISIKDTVLSGQICRKLGITRRYKKGGIGTSTGSDEIHAKPATYLFVYNNTDTVFYFDEQANGFLPLYIWNVQQDDTVCLPHLDSTNAAFCFSVDSVSEQTYDTTALKSYYINTTNFSGQGMFLSWYLGFEYSTNIQKYGLYIERIGGFHGLFPSSVIYNSIDAPSEIGYPAGKLSCYSDSTTFIKLTNMNCDSIPTPRSTQLSISDVNKSGLQIDIYPNPAANQVNIQAPIVFNTGSRLEAMDIWGKAVIKPTTLDRKKQYTLDISKWANGTYFLRFKTGNQFFYKKITVIH